MKILVTGAAGFIGFHVSMRLLKRGDLVVGLDNLNSYYDVTLKEDRLRQVFSANYEGTFRFIKLDLAERTRVEELFRSEKFDAVINLGAQAGVRHSMDNPHVYIDSNIVGFLAVLEGCRHNGVKHLVYASSSSVYGLNRNQPFSEHTGTEHPMSLYAATKKANEMMAHSYANLYCVPVTGLRFFTAYGPWGRPDMALFLFTKAIIAGEPIDVFNYGRHKRSFTYIDDIVEGIVRVLERPARPAAMWNGEKPDPAVSQAPYRVYNIGNDHSVGLLTYIDALEKALGKKARKNMLPGQPGDVPEAQADIDDIKEEFGFEPGIGIEEGVGRFVEWYLDYYRVPMPLTA